MILDNRMIERTNSTCHDDEWWVINYMWLIFMSSTLISLRGVFAYYDKYQVILQARDNSLVDIFLLCIFKMLMERSCLNKYISKEYGFFIRQMLYFWPMYATEQNWNTYFYIRLNFIWGWIIIFLFNIYKKYSRVTKLHSHIFFMMVNIMKMWLWILCHDHLWIKRILWEDIGVVQ